MTQYDGKILVFGASGKQGGAVVRHLRAGGFTDVHALVRAADSDSAGSLAGAGVTLETGDLDDSTSLDAAMKETYGVFCVLPLSQDPDADIRRGRAVAAAAQKRRGAALRVQLRRRC